LQYAADHGPPENKEKCRHLEEGIYEFKTSGGIRVLWFWDEDRMIVCTHAFVKKQQKTPLGEIEKAKRLRGRYFRDKSAGESRIRGD